MWAQIAVIVVSALIQIAMAPKPEKPKPGSISEDDVPQIDEGTPQAVTFGDCWAEDWLVLGMGNFRVRAIKVSSSPK